VLMGKLRRPRDMQTHQHGSRPMLASATLVRQSQLRTTPAMQDWQARAWTYYDQVGELRFVAQWISNALSRCGLYVGVVPQDTGPGSPEPIDVDDADDEAHDPRVKLPLDELFGGMAGQSEMLSRFGLHLTVPGESYLIAWDDEQGQRHWQVCSTEEFTRKSPTEFSIRLPDSDRQVTVPVGRATIIRLWRPHPRRAWEADSPIRAALGILKELVDLSAHITATVESRLAGAGLLIIPESATLPAAPTDGSGQLHEDPAMAVLIDAMVTPIQDRDSASAVVPIMVRVPDAATGKVEYIKFWSPLDDKVMELRQATIRRFATVVDVPAEVLGGAASTGGDTISHWGMWKIEESALKLHTRPLLGVICDSLTSYYFRPALMALGVAEPERYCIWFDDSELVQRPNKGPEAQNLYDTPAGPLIKAATTRRANGFSDSDAPDEEERRLVLLTQLAKAGIDPVLVKPYLDVLGIDIDIPAPVAAGSSGQDEQGGSGRRTMGRPTLPGRVPTRPEALPVTPDGRPAPAPPSRAPVAAVAAVASAAAAADAREYTALDVAALELAALRALELAGKRMLNNSNREHRGRLNRVSPWEIHTHIRPSNVDAVLDGAYALLDQALPDAPCIRTVIDQYVRERLSRQQPHDRARLLSMLAVAGCLSVPGGPRAIA
jgi:hypothetical protein